MYIENIMRIMVPFLFAVLIFSGCVDEYQIIVNNQSSQTIIYRLTTGYRTESYNLEPNEEKTHSLIKSLSHSMADYQSSPVQDGVNLTQSGDTYIFDNIEPIPCCVFNTWPKEVVLSGNGALNIDPVTIPEQKEVEIFILSKNPIFNAITIDGFPVQIDYIFNEETGYKISLR